VGIVLISQHNYVIPHAFSLTESCSNNVSEYNALFIRMQLAEEIGSKISKHTVIQNSSLTRFAGSTKSDMKTWRPITTWPLLWQRSLKTSILTIYRVSKIHMQMHWRPLPLRWPFSLEPQREYSSTVVTCTVANSPLKTVELQQETFKPKKFLRLWQVSSRGIGDSLKSTSSYMAYCLTTPKR